MVDCMSLHSQYFSLHIFIRGVEVYRVPKEDFTKVCQIISRLDDEKMVNVGPAELIIKHNYVSLTNDGRTIARLKARLYNKGDAIYSDFVKVLNEG